MKLRTLTALLLVAFLLAPAFRANGQTPSETERYLASYREAAMLVKDNALFASGKSLGQLLTASLGMIRAWGAGPIPEFTGKDSQQLEAAVRHLAPVFQSFENQPDTQRQIFFLLLYGFLRDLDAYAVPLSPVPIDPDPAKDVSLPKFLASFGLTEWGDGVITTEDQDHNYWVVGGMPGTPAASLDLRYGDQVMAINGYSMVPYDEAGEFKALQESIASGKITYVLRRFDKTFTLEIPFLSRRNPIVSGTLLSGQVAYVRIPAFGAGVGFEFLAVLKDLVAKGAKAVILDLRGNGGGLLMDAKIVMSVFKQGNLWQTRYRKGIVTETSLPVGMKFDGPLAILLDDNSASAAEVTPFVLRDRARLFGQNFDHTYGKGIGQQLYGLQNGWDYNFTNAQIFDFTGYSYHGVGVKVDEVVSVPEGKSENLVRDRALQWILKQIK